LFGLLALLLTYNEKMEIYLIYQERGNNDPIFLHLSKFNLVAKELQFSDPKFVTELNNKYSQIKLLNLTLKPS